MDRDEAIRQIQRFREWLTSDEGARTLEMSKYDPTALWACWLAAITQENEE